MGEQQLRDLPSEAQRWIAAHEYAHLHFRHHGTHSKALLLAAWAAIATATGLALAALSSTASGPLLAATSIAGVIALVGALALYAREIRPLEVEADRHATLWAGPMPESVVDALSGAEGRLAAVAPDCFRTHLRPRIRQGVSAQWDARCQVKLDGPEPVGRGDE